VLGTTWVTHSLAFAVAAAVLAAGSSTALAQASPPKTPQSSQPATPPAADDDASRDSPRQPAETTVTPLSLFDDRFSTRKPKSILESWLTGVEMQCIGCRGFEPTGIRPESTNATAPWVLQGRWRRQTTLGVVSAGFVGVRNYALPLSTAMPLGGEFDRAALGSSRASVFAPVSQWSLTAAVEKTLATRANGASVGVTADLLIPVKTESITVGDPRTSALTARTVRFGIVFRC
jgi:hypothetical protein